MMRFLVSVVSVSTFAESSLYITGLEESNGLVCEGASGLLDVLVDGNDGEGGVGELVIGLKFEERT